MRTTARQPTLIEHGNKDEIVVRDYLSLNSVLMRQHSIAPMPLLALSSCLLSNGFGQYLDEGNHYIVREACNIVRFTRPCMITFT